MSSTTSGLAPEGVMQRSIILRGDAMHGRDVLKGKRICQQMKG
jgi:hypothetical protein